MVIDTDGSAFITKAEFDSLKNNFQAQIDNYNSSIDSKIDGAIASYLAGIKLSTVENFEPYFAVSGMGSLAILSVKEDHHKQTEGYENSGNVDFVHQCPWFVNSMKPYDPGTHALAFFICDYVTSLSTPKMQAWQMKQDDNSVLIKKYNKDFIVIGGFVYFNANTYGNQEQRFWGIDLADNWDIRNVKKSFTWTWGRGVSIDNTTYPFFNAPYPRYCWYGSAGSYTSMTGSESFSVPTSYSSSINSYDTVRPGSYEVCNLTFTHTVDDEDKSIYLYNQCSDVIMVYPENSNFIKKFSDKINTQKEKTYKDSQVLVPNDCTRIAWGKGNETGALPDYYIAKHYAGFCIPKYKMKNTTSIVSLQDDSDGWVTLDKFKNGYLEYNVNGIKKYPAFYGGLPLWSSNKDYTESKFTIKIDTTTSGYTGNMKLWVKKGEFVNSNNFSSTVWTSTEKAKLVDITGDVGTKNSDGSLTIPSGTNVTVTIPAPRNGDTYYLRFCEANKTYGGKITYLSDFTRTLEN